MLKKMKTPRFYINGVDLRDLPVVQNETGKVYGISRNGPFYTPKLSDFDSATPPSGYNTYADASHSLINYGGVNVRAQNALDIGAIGNFACSEPVRVAAGNPNLGVQSWVNFYVGDYWIHCVHQYPLTPVGIVEPGRPICRTVPAAGHLHIYSQGIKIRDLILADEPVEKPIDDSFYFVKHGGWIWNVVEELIANGIWEGPHTSELDDRFWALNNPTPVGGYRAGDVVKIK